ncbi:MAG TPA: DUF5320 domain-containing protein [Bacteroidales bacterium]|nr:DUF5320 domain-containing protein [Bacteroidales bacterium]HNS46470.1 DUF5320 domain-containing protein [Bacteroidales bacterium]
MPGFDRTGPEGQGPMSGRKMGRCTNYGKGRKKQTTSDDEIKKDEDLPENPAGKGLGQGRGKGGRGRGMGRQNRSRGGN